ncbi:phage tail family protein, partial [Listeria monocytogenes]|nr:phage tail family protein [Listeria monocytogenes]
MAKIGFTYAGIHSNDIPAVVNSIKRNAINISENMQEVPAKIGGYFFGNSVGTRSFDINITLMGKSEAERVEIAHDLSNLIIQTNSFENEIIFDDEPEWVYYGHFAQMAELTELQTDNYTTTITFVCSDPRAYGEQREITVSESPAIIEVEGSQLTSPIIHAIATEDLTSLSFATD